MVPTFEPTNYRDLVRECSRRATQANDKIDVVDAQQSINALFDTLIECTPERAATLFAKGMEAASTRLKKARCSDK